MGTIEITAEYPDPFHLRPVQANYEINGRLDQRPWGRQRFVVVPGRHLVAVSYPWWFISRAGKSAVEVDVADGEIIRVHYRARMLRYAPGTITVGGTLPEARIV